MIFGNDFEVVDVVLLLRTVVAKLGRYRSVLTDIPLNFLRRPVS